MASGWKFNCLRCRKQLVYVLCIRRGAENQMTSPAWPFWLLSIKFLPFPATHNHRSYFDRVPYAYDISAYFYYCSGQNFHKKTCCLCSSGVQHSFQPYNSLFISIVILSFLPKEKRFILFHILLCWTWGNSDCSSPATKLKLLLFFR